MAGWRTGGAVLLPRSGPRHSLLFYLAQAFVPLHGIYWSRFISTGDKILERSSLNSSLPILSVIICTPFMLNNIYPLKCTTLSTKNLPPFFLCFKFTLGWLRHSSYCHLSWASPWSKTGMPLLSTPITSYVSLSHFSVVDQFHLLTQPTFGEWFLTVRHNGIHDKSLPTQSLC